MLSTELIAAMDARFFQYSLESTIAANGQDLPQKQIQNGFHFWSEFLTITYTTLVAGPTDDGVNHITAQFKSGANQIGLSNDFIDLATIAVPGRQRAIGVTGDPNQEINIQGFPWPYLYEAAGSIIADCRNNSAYANTVNFVWTGFLIPTYKVNTPQDFYAMLARQFPEYGVPQRQA